MNLLLTRISYSDQGTKGILSLGDAFVHTLELPWRDNEKTFSCIPTGIYTITWHKSPKFGWTYKVQGTSPREEILIHAGNFAGDRRLGYKSNSYGCILPCLKFGILNGQLAGLLSKPALSKLFSLLDKQTFLLEVK